MILAKLHIHGFGCLAQQEFEFHPGLNVIFGPNESGKSTLQQAILSLLFGIYSRSRPTSSEKQYHERFRPWHFDQYGGELAIRMDDGREYLITRRFDGREPQTRIFETSTGQEVTQNYFSGRRGYVEFLEALVGLSRRVFEATACFKQGELAVLRDDDAKEINDYLMRFIDSGASDASARLALDRLSKAIRSLGTDRSRSGPIYELRQDIQRTEALLEERKSLAKQLESDYLKIQHLKGQIESLQQRETEIERDVRLCDYQELQNLIQRHEKLAVRKQELEQQLNQIQRQPHIPVTNRDVVLKLMQERKLLREERQHMHEELRHLQSELKKARYDLDALPPDQDFWTRDDLNQFFELQRRWERMQQFVDQIEAERKALHKRLNEMGIAPEIESKLNAIGFEALEALQDRENELKEKQADLDGQRQEIEQRRRYFMFGRIAVVLVLFISFFLAISSMLPNHIISFQDSMSDAQKLMSFLATPLAIMWLIFELLFKKSIRTWEGNIDYEQQLLQMEQNELREVLSQFGVDRAEELLKISNRYSKFRELNAEALQHVQAQQELVEAIKPWLKTFQFRTLSLETLARIAEMLRHGQQLRRYIDELNQKISEIEKKLADKDQRLQDIHERLRTLFLAANCWTGNLEQDAESFFQAVARGQKYDALMKEWDQISALEQEMLGGQTIEQVHEKVQALESAVSERQSVTNLPPKKELEQLLDEVRGQRQQLQIELAALQERVNERESKLPDLSELEEKLAIFQQEMDELLRKRQALQLAYETLSEVAQETHQSLAPELADIIGRYLAQLTDHRYEQVFIDPASFDIKISHAVARTLVPLYQLSFGTQEQMFLLLRTALTQFFSRSTDTIPLFLDDPLVHADAQRQENMLKILLRLARTHQLFYFTKDQSVIDMLAGLGADFQLISLQPMQTQQPMRWAAGTVTLPPDEENTSRQ
ncbi:MAG: AAA family ATPase [candidate division KSB1 bacterium]|nr:AAA family ATPase [candidate division KSB1 bacterium]